MLTYVCILCVLKNYMPKLMIIIVLISGACVGKCADVGFIYKEAAELSGGGKSVQIL